MRLGREESFGLSPSPLLGSLPQAWIESALKCHGGHRTGCCSISGWEGNSAQVKDSLSAHSGRSALWALDQGTSHPAHLQKLERGGCHLSVRQLLSSHLVSKFKLFRVSGQRCTRCRQWLGLSHILWPIDRMCFHRSRPNSSLGVRTGVVFCPETGEEAKAPDWPSQCYPSNPR